MLSFRTFLLFTLCVLVSFSLHSQPIIDSGFIPTDGDKWEVEFLEATNFSPGSAGANQTWDFAGLDQNTAQSLNFEILPLSSAVGSNLFPDADFCWHLKEFGIYNYYQANMDSMSLMGVVSASNQDINFLTTFNKPEDVIRFPISYQDSYSYTSQFTSGIPGSITFDGEREGTVEVDGFGTLITPFGTYENVLRMVIIEKDNLSNITDTQYAWIEADNFTPLMVYNTSTDGEEPPSLYYSRPLIVNNTKDLLSPSDLDFQILGNPSQDRLRLKITSEQKLDKYQIQLIATDGRLLYQSTNRSTLISEERIEIPVQQLAAGLYFIKCSGAGTSLQKAWIKR